MIRFRINRGSGVPAYMQVVTQTVEAIRLGHLRPGDQLPTLREVVLDTGMNPNTVGKAYRELERAGVVEGRRGVGTFVRPGAVISARTGDSGLRARLVEWTRDAINSGMSGAEVREMLSSVPAEILGDEREEWR